MSILSIEFFIMVAFAVVIYWIFPAKHRWIILLLASLLFIYLSNNYNIKACIIMLSMVLMAYATSISWEKVFSSLKKKIILLIALSFEAGLLVVLKQNIFFSSSSSLALIAPFGMSYFTLTIIGYILDTYWGVQEKESNPLKLLLFVGYFPLLTSGPIVKYKNTGEELLKCHKFCYKNIAFGCQRILWGIFKKLVIAERLSIFVNEVYGNPEKYVGLFVWISVLLFVIQLYCDFSGCLDIIYGVSDLFGISLPENFNTPFVSRSLEEFWRRWHITLGGWLREYIYYPIMKSSFMQKISETSSNHFGKKTAKKISLIVGLFFPWLLIGFWHGGTMNYVFGVGLYMWIIIVISELLSPIFKSIIIKMNIKQNCFSWHMFQSIRTVILFAIGNGFFPASSFLSGVALYKAGISVFNPNIIFDGSLIQLGLSSFDYKVLGLAILIICIAGIIRISTDMPIRNWIANQNFLFRWGIWIGLFVFTLIFGKYGPGYDPAEFIYRGF